MFTVDVVLITIIIIIKHLWGRPFSSALHDNNIWEHNFLLVKGRFILCDHQYKKQPINQAIEEVTLMTGEVMANTTGAMLATEEVVIVRKTTEVNGETNENYANVSFKEI